MSARAAPSANLSLGTHILNPPNAVTDLSASPVGSQDGDVQLLWTAPSNLNRVAMSHYFVRYTTYPAVNPAQAETWWSLLSTTQKTVSPAHAAGVQEFTTITGLTVNVTYYFGMKAVDNDAQISLIDTRAGTVNQAQSMPLNNSGPPSTPTNFTGVALTTSSIQWSWNASAGAGFYTLNAYPSGTLITQTNSLTATETGLTPNAPIARTLSAANGSGLSGPTVAQTVYTLSAAPTYFAATNVGFTSVTLAWNANGNPAGTQYRLERSLDGASFTVLTLSTSLGYTDSGLTELTSYYYRLRTLNGDGIATAPTAVVTAFTPLQVDYVAPNAPAGLKGALDATGFAFTLIWENVTHNTNGTPIDDLVGYNIYRQAAIGGARTKLTPAPLSVTAFADQVNSQTYYYTVRAIDTTGNESTDSLIADSSPDVNIIYIATDGVTAVHMPNSINDLLRSAYNKYGVPLTVRLLEEPLTTSDSIVRHIRINLLRADNQQVLTDLAFSGPQATVAVGYSVVGGQVGRGAPLGQNTGSAKAVQASAISPEQLSLFWFNGVTWVKVGGKLNLNVNTLSTKSSFLGNYQIRGIAASTTLSLGEGNVYPRLFTPNGDGLNDRVYFVMENPRNASVTGEIIDKEGRHVRTLPPPAAGAGIGTTLIWDGKDDQGNVVPGGAYIYRIQGEGKSFTGTVGVAR